MNHEISTSHAEGAPAKRPERVRARQVKKAMIELLRKLPLVEAACAKAGISRSTHYEWMKSDSRYAAAVEEAVRLGRDAVNDHAERNIIQGIKDGDHKSAVFWLIHNSRRNKKPPIPATPPSQESELAVKINQRLEEAIKKYEPKPATESIEKWRFEKIRKVKRSG